MRFGLAHVVPAAGADDGARGRMVLPALRAPAAAAAAARASRSLRLPPPAKGPSCPFVGLLFWLALFLFLASPVPSTANGPSCPLIGLLFRLTLFLFLISPLSSIENGP